MFLDVRPAPFSVDARPYLAWPEIAQAFAFVSEAWSTCTNGSPVPDRTRREPNVDDVGRERLQQVQACRETDGKGQTSAEVNQERGVVVRCRQSSKTR